MSLVLGLDISTSVVGWCILDKDTNEFVSAGAIDLKKIKCVFHKATNVFNELKSLERTHRVDYVAIEENLQAFRPGFSSAKTLVSLARFNGMVSLYSHDIFGIVPDFINVNHARKLVGLKIDRKSSLSTKEQVFDFVKGRLPGYDWPMKTMKSGPRKGLVLFADGCYDISDAYVIAASCVKNE